MRVRPSIVLFGDSITQYAFGEDTVQVGWASMLAASYQRCADVFNRGFSGYTTRHALDLVPRVFGPKNGNQNDASDFLFVTVFFGANDCALPGERQHVPLKEYSSNLVKIINAIREHTKLSSSFPIFIMTPPPICDDVWKMQYAIDHYDRKNSVAREYGLEVKRVADELENCHVLDTWELLDGENEVEAANHLCDGLHLSESGNRLIHRGLMELIKKEYPDLVPQAFVDGEYVGRGIPVDEKLWSDLC